MSSCWKSIQSRSNKISTPRSIVRAFKDIWAKSTRSFWLRVACLVLAALILVTLWAPDDWRKREASKTKDGYDISLYQVEYTRMTLKNLFRWTLIGSTAVMVLFGVGFVVYMGPGLVAWLSPIKFGLVSINLWVVSVSVPSVWFSIANLYNATSFVAATMLLLAGLRMHVEKQRGEGTYSLPQVGEWGPKWQNLVFASGLELVAGHLAAILLICAAYRYKQCSNNGDPWAKDFCGQVLHLVAAMINSVGLLLYYEWSKGVPAEVGDNFMLADSVALYTWVSLAWPVVFETLYQFKILSRCQQAPEGNWSLELV